MNLLLSQHPHWVWISIWLLTLVCAEEEVVVTNNSNNVPSFTKQPLPFTITYLDRYNRKESATISTELPATLGKTAAVSDEGEIREGRIMVPSLLTNRTSDTNDFARNTVPIKDQTPTDPTVKKTEPPRKHIRKPSTDFKAKVRIGDRTKSGGPPGPDVSMLAYNAYSTQLTEPTTERNNIKSFTTKSRPPPLSYLSSLSSDLPPSLPPTAWALTTLKGSTPSITSLSNNSSSSISSSTTTIIEQHIKNTIPATVAVPFKPYRPRLTTTIPSVKPINNYWSTRLTKIPYTSPGYAVVETTEPIFTEQRIKEEVINKTSNTNNANEELTKSEDNSLNKLYVENSSTNSEQIATDRKHSVNLKGEESQTIKLKEEQVKVKEGDEELTTLKEQNQTNAINEIELPKVTEQVVNNNKTVIKIEEPIEEINEAIKPEEENRLKIVEEKYKIKQEKEEKISNIVVTSNNFTTENYRSIFTEKPLNEEGYDKVNKTAVLPSIVVTELNKIITDSIQDIEHENNYNTAVYPKGNVINETKLTHKEPDEIINQIDNQTLINNETELMNTIVTSTILNSSINRTNNIINETNQSTTSMTRATNATQPPVNTTTEPNVVTMLAMNSTSTEPNVTEIIPVTMATTPLINLQDDSVTTVITNVDLTQYRTIRNDISDVTTTSSVILQNNTVTTVSPSPTTIESIEGEHGNSTKNDVKININNLENTLNTTLKENDIKYKTSSQTNYNFSNFVQSTTEINTLQPLITTAKIIEKRNNSLPAIRNNYELNQTNNDIKLGGDLDLPIPTQISVTSSPSVKSDYIKTTTEKIPTTILAEVSRINGTVDLPVTDISQIKSTRTEENTDSIITTTPSMFHETGDAAIDEDGLTYNTTGNDKKFAIDTAFNITDHDLDDIGGGEDITDDKDMAEILPNGNTTMVIPEETTVTPELAVTSEYPQTTTVPTSVPPSTHKATIAVTTTMIEDDGVTAIDEDNTGMEIDDYDTGVIMQMNIRLLVHATYKDMCQAKDLLIDSIVRFFKTIADRTIDRKQVKVLNLIRECQTPYPADNGVVPVHLLITDNQGQYDKRLTDIFVTLVSQEPLSFKYPITQVDKFIAHELGTSVNDSPASGSVIAAIIISCIAGLCLLVLTILLVIMRKRQRGFNYGQRCTPVSLDDYSLDNISVYNSVRRKAMRASKRSYGNPAFDDPAAISNCLNFAVLANVINDKNKLEEEYSKIPVITVKSDELPPGAEVKNRYANVIPLPETRVVLNTSNNNDIDQFINANFVKGVKGVEKFYIACQAPMKETVSDFWQMIWEQQSRVIIMLTDYHENGVEKCADYLPPSEVLDCHRVFGDLQVTLKKRETREKYVISSLQLKNLESNLWREVTHMWYVGWPARGVPDDYSSIIAFLIEARSYAKSGPPIVVHCSPGTGRTGTIIAIDIAVREFETNRTVDIPRTVYNVRRDRAGAVQTNQQYIFIYQVLHLYATKLTGGGLDSI